MSTHAALITAGTVFGIVSCFHLLRLFYRATVVFAGKVVPMWVSVVGFIIALSLSIWMFTAVKQSTLIIMTSDYTTVSEAKT